MRIAELFHAVKTAEESMQHRFWDVCVKTASQDPDGTAVGLMKIALDVWAEEIKAGRQPSVDRDAREAYASSFGSAHVALRTAEKLAGAGELTNSELNVVRHHIVSSAINDLVVLTKAANAFPQDPQMQDPQMQDQPPQDPQMQGRPPQDPNIAPQDPGQEGPEAIGEQTDLQGGMVEDLNRAQDTIKNLMFMAQQVQRPALAQQIQEQSELLLDHFSRGNNYLPPEFQGHFAKSEHAEEFMKKYKQRFGAIGGKSSAK